MLMYRFYYCTLWGEGGECGRDTPSGVNVGILASADLFYMNKNLYNTLKGNGKAKNA